MCFEISKPLDGLKGNIILRQRAINKYYNTPNYCKNCNNLIKIRCNEKVVEVRRKIFCNRKCSSTYNNIGVNRYLSKFGQKSRICDNCGGNKASTSKLCSKCNLDVVILNQERKTLKEVALNFNSSLKWNYLRLVARRKLKINKVKQECLICGFTTILEVCHIIPISSFTLDTLVGEVNSLKNIVYLCPNHHKMLDRKILSRQDIYDKMLKK